MTMLSTNQAHSERLNSMAHAYQMGMRIIANEDIVVCAENHPHMGAAAWTDGIKITLNSSKIDAVDATNVERMRGVNLHEMAHVLFSPRAGSRLMVWVQDHGFMQEFNILEDQRIETFLTRMYPATAPWLTTAISRWVLNGGDPETGYSFVRGRKYLPGKLRGALRANFSRQDLLPRLDAIVDEYRELVFPSDYTRAMVLIQEWADLFADITPPSSGGSQPDPNGHSDRPQGPMTEGHPKGESKQQHAADKAGNEEDEVPPPASDTGKQQDTSPDEQSDDESDSDADGAPGDEQSDDLGDEEDSTPGGKSDDMSDGDSGDAQSSPESGSETRNPASEPSSTPGTPSSESESGQGEPSGTSASGAGSSSGMLQDLMDIAQEVLDNVLDSAEVQDDIRRTLKQIKSAGGSDIIEKAIDWKHQSPDPDYAALLRSLRRSIDRLIQKADPGWDRRQSSGKLNASRWYRDRDIDSAFDMWDEGIGDAFDLEVVIMVDESGSMGSHMRKVLNSMWVIKRAFDKAHVSTTVITFSDQSRILYHRKDKAEGQIRYTFSGAGTNPAGGLAQAARIFSRSDKSQKILLIFTDGEWTGYHTDPAADGVSGEVYIDRMNAGGVTTALGFINTSTLPQTNRTIDGHHCVLKGEVTTQTLVPFMSSVITSSIQSKLTGR